MFFSYDEFKVSGLMRLQTIVFLALCVETAVASEAEIRVRISPDTDYVMVNHEGREIRIERVQDPTNTIRARYGLTSRACPPFCIQPATLAPGVETIGELELLDYLARQDDDEQILVIDSRTPDWLDHGTIPGSKNIPWKQLAPTAGADPFEIQRILEDEFGALLIEELWDFSQVKTLVLFCNGPWCGQSPANIRTLLRFGYPAVKLKWYRGGMQAWESLGLTTVRPTP